MVYDPHATTETFSPDNRDASNMARVILSKDSVTADEVGVAVSKLDDILDRKTILSKQVSGTMGEKLWTDFENERPS